MADFRVTQCFTWTYVVITNMRFQTHCPVGYVKNITLFYVNLYCTTVPVASFGLLLFFFSFHLKTFKDLKRMT